MLQVLLDLVLLHRTRELTEGTESVSRVLGMLFVLRSDLNLRLQHLEQDRHHLCVLLQEVRDNMLTEVADREARRLSDNLLTVLQPLHENISE